MKESPFFHNVVLSSFDRAMEEKDVERMMVHARKVKDYVIEHKITYAKDQVIGLFELGKEQIVTEEKITYLKYEIEILRFYEEVEFAVKNMCDCAYLFAQAGEYQSAYRILYDANSYAVENKSLDAMVRTLQVQGEICIYEGDYETAFIELGKARSLLKEVDADIPRSLDANIALVKYRKGDFGGAKKDYEKMLGTCRNEDAEWWGLTLNKMLCQWRQCEDRNVILKDLNRLKEKSGLVGNKEQIEYDLIAAEIFLKLDEEKTVLHLYHAVELIEQITNENVRLHYRRGVRETYCNRVKHVLCRMTKPCRLQNEVVAILVFLNMNMMTEWLAVKEFVRCTQVLEERGKEEADAVLKRMEGEGIPILYGFSEKYDDPFEEYGPFRERDTVNKMWNDLAGLLAQNRISVEALYKSVSCKAVSEYITKDNGGLYVFVECYAEGMAVWFQNGELVEKRVWEKEHVQEYLEKYMLFQVKGASRTEFRKQLETDAAMLKLVFEPVIGIIEGSDHIKMHVLTDIISATFPFLSIFIQQEKVKKMIDAGRFAFVLNPILYVGEKRTEEEIRVDFVEYDEENLVFQDAEFDAVASRFRTERCRFDNWAGRDVHEETVIHLSSHGMPIGMYTDPVFAKIRGESPGINISIPAIQQVAQKSDYRFVCINCCYGGAFSNRNHFKSFRTNELIGYQTAFMLNGKAAVIAPKWQVMDLVAVFFTELLYQNIAKEKEFSKSYIKAVKELYWLDIEDSRKIAGQILQEEIRRNALAMLERCPVSYPFQNLTDVGAYHYFELL